ncbi:Ig-like domain-containing protein [Listeria rustica]|uniref:Uncharacterized protein n=1 Tax=Listeria rustica TaxID=2713503 RepID=A0A7W1YGH5_9LIST|nr:Ig-like domain-containing protein [Listeria rustica]MBA3926790.1 hypothetical protein [Listeria rustica]
MKKKLGITVLIMALIIPSMTWASEETAAPKDVAPLTEEVANVGVETSVETPRQTDKSTTPKDMAPLTEEAANVEVETSVETPHQTDKSTTPQDVAPLTEEAANVEVETSVETPRQTDKSATPKDMAPLTEEAANVEVETSVEAPRQTDKSATPATEPKTEKSLETDPIVTIKDSELHNSITDTLHLERGTSVTQSMMASLTTLDTSRFYIEDTTGLEYAVNLREFISGNDFRSENLERILQLHHLEILSLGTQIYSEERYPSFSSLPKLRELTVGDAGMRDLNFLSKNTALEKLELGSQVSDNYSLTDISALQNLPLLKYLALYFTREPLDLSPISTLSHLESLRLQEQRIQDASFLAPLKHLTYLDLTNNWLTNVDSLQALPSLQEVILDGNYIFGKPNQYAAQLPTETTELAIGESIVLPMTWTYNGVPVGPDYQGHFPLSVPFRSYSNTVTSSPAILTITKPTLTTIPVEATKEGVTTLTSEVVPGYKVQTKVRVLDIPKPPTLSPVSDLQDTLNGKTSPGYTIRVDIAGKTYKAVADETGAFAIQIGMHAVDTPYVVTISDPTGTEGKPVHAAIVDIIVTIPNTNLRNLITDTLHLERKTPITRSMMASLTTLKASSPYIEDFTGLEYAVNLREFSGSVAKSADIERILQLHHLEILSLKILNYDSYPSFSSLPKLRELTLSAPRLIDLNFLSKNTALEKLELGGKDYDNRALTDISALQNLSLLKSLSLYYTIKKLDLSPISTLSHLESLRLQEQRIQDTSFLAPLKHLTYLDLTNNWLTNVDSLQALPSLQEVILDGNYISGKPNQYAAQLPTETTELAIGESIVLPMTWTYNGLPLVPVSPGYLGPDVPFSNYSNTVTSSPAILTITKPTLTTIPVEATKGGVTTLTSEVVPGYKVQTKVRVLDIPKPPTLSPVSVLQDTLHGKTSPGYTIQVDIAGKTYEAVADETGTFAIQIGMHAVDTPYVVTVSDPTGTKGTPVLALIVDGVAPQLNKVTVGIQAISGRIIDGRSHARVLINGVMQREVDTDADGYYSVPVRKVLMSNGAAMFSIRSGDTIQVDYGADTPEHFITRQVVKEYSRPTTVDPVQARADYITGQTLPGSQTLRLIVNGIPQRVITPRSAGAGQIDPDGRFKIYSRFNLDANGQLVRLNKGDKITVDSGEQIYHAAFVETIVQ